MRFAPTIAVLAVCASAQAAPQKGGLPTVDLGYTIQKATAFNDSAQYYNFSNIRYGEPPLGNLRFNAPVPAKRNRTVQDGQQGRICYQSNPAWLLYSTAFITDVLTGQNISAFADNSTGLAIPPSKLPPATSYETEDCLFLDVVVPENTFKNRGHGKGKAVLVWIYGGGYTAGSKLDYDPVGLFARSVKDAGDDVVFVALNYRLGAFGWLAGSTFESNGTSNAGLLDQRLALEWVQQHIHMFGGDPKRVTVFGESAGGGSIMHQITAYAGHKGPAPFHQAIPQSPGWQPLPGNFESEQNFNNFLKTAKVNTIQDARGLSSEDLRAANYLQVGASAWGTFTYGPAVDGDFVTDQPGKLLLQGKYDKSLKVMAGHNADEGLLFTSPTAQTDAGFDAYVKQLIPTADDSVIKYITDTLYPAKFDGSLGYTDDIQRTALANSEAIFTCNTNYLARAYGNNTYNYLFSVPPAIHGEDVSYTFYSSPNAGVINVTIAETLQGYITSFAVKSQPNSPHLPRFPKYGTAANLQNLNITGVETIKDPTSNPRCLWWQKALYA